MLVELKHVSKIYPRTQKARDRFRALVRIILGNQLQTGSTVLKDINFVVRRGQSMAIIGENGAGKSTLLKILTGVLRPTAGSVQVNASVAAMLELGAGFQPEYTGLENIRMKAALMGLPRKEINRKLDAILAFADIGDSIHEPVKHYSSGMVVRLGFAVITAVNPELLVTDEILAVGDESFQKKCIAWIENYLQDGGTLLMVSHNIYQVQKLCQQACWVHHGELEMKGDVFRVTQAYLAYHEDKSARSRRAGISQGDNGGRYRIETFKLLLDDDSGDAPELPQGADLRAEALMVSPDQRPPVVLFGIVRADGTPVYGVSSDQLGIQPIALGDGLFRYRIRFQELPLLPGSYSLRAHTMDPEGVRLLDSHEARFVVSGESRELGFVRLKNVWNESQ